MIISSQNEELEGAAKRASVGNAHRRPSMSSDTPSMNDKQWAKLTVLVERAAKLNFMTAKQTEIIEKCIERREQTVLSVLATSKGNFTKVFKLILTKVCSTHVSCHLGLFRIVDQYGTSQDIW